MKLIAATPRDLENIIKREEFFAQLSKSYEDTYPRDGREFVAATYVCQSTLIWAWCLWLKGGDLERIRDGVSSTLQKSRRLLGDSKNDYFRADHAVRCASLAATFGDLESLRILADLLPSAESETSSDLCLIAWSGVWKYSIQGHWEKAKQQANLLFEAGSPINLRLPRRPVVRAWVDHDWPGFQKAIASSYGKMWKGLSKQRSTVILPTSEVEFSLSGMSASTDFHWQENAFSMMAKRLGVEVPSDSLWLPEMALSAAERLDIKL